MQSDRLWRNTNGQKMVANQDDQLRAEGKPDVLQSALDMYLPLCSISGSEEAQEFRDLARFGDPFPLIAYQWPNLLIEEDDPDAEFFDGIPGDPVNPCLRLDRWQRDEVISPFFDDTIYEICVKGCTGPGKGASVAICVNLWFEVFDPSKTVLSSSDFNHAKRNIYAEVVKWRKQMREPAAGRTLTHEIKDHDQHYVVVSNPASGEGFSGQHSPFTLFVLDEATSIPGERYLDACKQGRKIAIIGNPRVVSGWFFRLWEPCGVTRDTTQTVQGHMGKRRCVTVGGADCANVRHERLKRNVAPPGGIVIDGERFQESERLPKRLWPKVKPLIPAQCDLAQYRGIRAHPDPRHVSVFADGKFPDEDPEKQVILPSWLPRHVQAWRECSGNCLVNCFGFDVGASQAGDASVLAAGSDEGCSGLHSWKCSNVLEHVDRIIQIASQQYGINLTEGQIPVVVDEIGVGKGTADRLEELGIFTIRYNAALNSRQAEYINLRAESYGMLGRRLSPQDIWKDRTWQIPDDSELLWELTAPEKQFPGGDGLRWKLEPKDGVKQKVGRSPDKGDAVVMLYHGILAVSNWFDLSGEFASFDADDLTEEEVSAMPDGLRDIYDVYEPRPDRNRIYGQADDY